MPTILSILNSRFRFVIYIVVGYVFIVVCALLVGAYEFGLITTSTASRKMRDVVKSHSDWAPFQHGFETHLSAIVFAWANHKMN